MLPGLLTAFTGCTAAAIAAGAAGAAAPGRGFHAGGLLACLKVRRSLFDIGYTRRIGAFADFRSRGLSVCHACECKRGNEYGKC